jgi:hypothetical protein
MSAEPPIIVSRIGNRAVKCPVALLTQLQRERQTHWIDIESSISEVEDNALLADAERIKQSYIRHADSSA